MQLLNLSLMLKLTSCKNFETSSEAENVNDETKEIQKFLDLFKQIEELIEPYRPNNFEVFDIEILKKILDGYHAAFFSCANLQLHLKTMQLSSSELKSAST